MGCMEKISEDKLKYLKLLSEKYPSIELVSSEIINLNAILNLPKGTEHFMSDIHGEYEAFYHILNNCAGVIKEKVELIFEGSLTAKEQRNLCTLIYYPEEKLKLMKKEGPIEAQWYRNTIKNLIRLADFLSSKYTRSKVRKAMPKDFSYIIDELLHAPEGEDNNQQVYHSKILETIIEIGGADQFIVDLCPLIKRLAVDHLHIVGDIYDRGGRSDEIMDLLMDYHSLDIEWGNHDILWMGASAGSDACIFCVLQINVKYSNMPMLENGYGIPLRNLMLYAQREYPDMELKDAALHTLNILRAKLEGQVIMRHPEYDMDDRLLLFKLDREKKHAKIGGKLYRLNKDSFPTIDMDDPYKLSPAEEELVSEMRAAFEDSEKLRRHVEFLYEKGSVYKCFNDNLLLHGCVPLDENGELKSVTFEGKSYKGKAYLDYADTRARKAYYGEKDQDNLDFMWYLWGGKRSPLCGRNIKTFERTFLSDAELNKEEEDPYYTYYKEEESVKMILREFGLNSPLSHIINGHTPVKTGAGEDPVKAGGKVVVIDGGFCKAYQKTTGIAGYTLIYNSRGMRLKDHRPFESIEKVLEENKDIESNSNSFETEPFRVMVGDTDKGGIIKDNIEDLKLLLYAYREGILVAGGK